MFTNEGNGMYLRNRSLAVGVEDEFARQARVGRGEQREDRGVDRQEVAAGAGLVEDLGEEPGARRVDRVAAGHPERDRRVARDLVHQVDAAVIRPCGLGEVAFLQAAGKGG